MVRSTSRAEGDRTMNAVTQVFAVLAGLVHVGAFVAESLLFRRPAVQRIFLGRTGVEPGVYLWAFNQGFYNLFVAAGAIGGIIALHAGHPTVGRALTLYACAFMAACGVVLVVSDRNLWRGALGQSVPPLTALLAALL
jgi:putative membrane protein